MPPGNPAPFYSRDYWDVRFTKEPDPFDWLHPANVLDEQLKSAIAKCTARGVQPKILHIGCGTSLLSLRLRSMVDDPSQIWNVDFSSKAVAVGKLWEHKLVHSGIWESLEDSAKSLEKIQEVLKNATEEQSQQSRHNEHEEMGGSQQAMMHWEAVDLLSLPSISAALQGQSFDIIVEKSCSDAIACGEDIDVETLDPTTSLLSLYSTKSPGISSTPHHRKEDSFVHPVNLLALHLAHIAAPGSVWLMLTFSEDRIPFRPHPIKKPIQLPPPLPDPIEYWKPTIKERVLTAESGNQVTDGPQISMVYRPEVYHFIMVLERSLEHSGADDVALASAKDV